MAFVSFCIITTYKPLPLVNTESLSLTKAEIFKTTPIGFAQHPYVHAATLNIKQNGTDIIKTLC